MREMVANKFVHLFACLGALKRTKACPLSINNNIMNGTLYDYGDLIHGGYISSRNVRLDTLNTGHAPNKKGIVCLYYLTAVRRVPIKFLIIGRTIIIPYFKFSKFIYHVYEQTTDISRF